MEWWYKWFEKQVETSKEPIKDTQTSKDPITYTRIVKIVHNLSVGTTNVDPVVTGVLIIGQGGPRAISRGIITQGIIHGGKSIISINAITHVLTNSSYMILKSDSFPLNPLKSQTLVIAPLTKPFLTCDRDVRVSSKIGYSRPDYSRIGTPFANKEIWSRNDNFSVRSEVGKADKLDTAVQRSLTNENNTAYLRIVEDSMESICPKIIKESISSERMDLANSLLVHTPKLVSFGHPPMETDNVGHQSNGSVATRVVDQDGIWRPTDRDFRMAPTHGNTETISEKLAYRKFIRDLEFETKEVFERETSNKDFENIGTRLDQTQLEKNG